MINIYLSLSGNIMTLSYYIGLTLGASVAYGLDEALGPPLAHPCGHVRPLRAAGPPLRAAGPPVGLPMFGNSTMFM